MDAVLTVRQISKRFGAVTALDDVALDLVLGMVSAIVGENGAGKSTLAKIVAGLYRADAGTITLDGRDVRFAHRRAAMAAGIGFVPQALSFIGTMTIVENHVLSRRGFLAHRDAARRHLSATAEAMNVTIVLDRPVDELSLAQRQLGEIVSAVADGARVLLLDEPTSTLGPDDIDHLVAALRRLAAQRIAIGLVTHRVREVLDGADHVTVLRQGKLVFAGETAGLDANAVARLMVGDGARPRPALPRIADAPPRLRVENLRLTIDGHLLLDNIGFTVRPGEILGVAGVSGPTQPALAETLAGLRWPAQGHVLVDGTEIMNDAALAQRKGVAYIPEDRGLGIAPDLTVAANASLLRLGEAAFRRFGLRRPKAEARHGAAIAARYDVRPNRPDIAAGKLSGGNQQKLLVGRELERGPAVVIAHCPTQGLDLAAAAAIHAALADAAAKGAAVVLISADLDELLGFCHRLIVLASGRITADMALDTPPDRAALGAAMAGLDFKAAS